MADAEKIETTLYLTLQLEKELLAIEVSSVREILDLCAITRVPRTPSFMKGVINLRGMVIPVIDLRRKFGMPHAESTIAARIVVLEFNMDGNETTAGILTDSVHDVIDIDNNNIDASPESGTSWRREFVKGIGKHGNNFILLLDMTRVFSGTEISSAVDSQAETSV